MCEEGIRDSWGIGSRFGAPQVRWPCQAEGGVEKRGKDRVKDMEMRKQKMVPEIEGRALSSQSLRTKT